MSNKIGVCIIGSNGAVATTVMAGVALMKKGLVPRRGMATEGNLGKVLDLASIDEMVFGGWDLREDNAYQAALSHGVVQKHLLDEVRSELESFKPWPAAASAKFLFSMAGKNIVACETYRDEIKAIQKNITDFKKANNLDRVVMVNLTSTEKFTEVSDVHRTIEAFEKGLDHNDARISPAMKYMYAACQLGVPHVNFTPSLTKIPALEKLAEKTGTPICGEDGKTGQTLLKTVLAPAFAIRQLHVDGWYSANILGNNDGLVLNDPESNKTKITSKQKPLDSIMGYKVDNHQVHIHYYRPRGDAKEAWDNIDVSGFLGENMQIKVNFLCKDSILAAPLVIDLVRLIDLAKRKGEAGIQRQLSLFFKAPYHTEGEEPIHDLFKQNDLLLAWAEGVKSNATVSDRRGYEPGREHVTSI
ncbi:MAG TPA: inositol-3-phosphate synthase [Bdellovibrionota bacterium]|nr:inositol-3-phosphate synthase [Bdellovibrionota bacterium]